MHLKGESNFGLKITKSGKFFNFCFFLQYIRVDRLFIRRGLTNKTETFIYYADYCEECIQSVFYYSMDEIFKQLSSNSSFKGAAVQRELDLFMHNYKKRPEERLIFRKLEQKAISYNLAVTLPPFWSFLHSTFKSKVNQLIHGGFFKYWLDPYLNHPSMIEEPLEEDKIVLTFDHLSVGFTLWIGMLLIALLSFIAELARFRVPIYVKALVIKIVLRSFYEISSNH